MNNLSYLSDNNNTIIILLAGFFGLLIGSFLNVVIHRIPKMMQRESENYLALKSGAPIPHIDRFNLILPRSACPLCGHKITAKENIPILSYLLLRGKCSACNGAIPIQFPLVELGSAILSALVIWHYGFNIAGISALIYVCTFSLPWLSLI